MSARSINDRLERETRITSNNFLLLYLLVFYINVPVPWEFAFVLYSIAHSCYSTHMNEQRKPHIIWRNVGGHNLAVGMGSDFDLHDLLKPHLSPALPHWKRTRVSAGQLDHNITIASTLTFQASLITSTTRTGNGQDYWQVQK